MYFLFFLIALIYALAGFGGGSSYLAVLALWGVPMEVMRPTALLCNIVVVTSGTYIFWRNGYLQFRNIWPLMAVSVPCAFIGGAIKLDKQTFLLVLGISLIAAAFLMLTPTHTEQQGKSKSYPIALFFALGGSIGLLSGLTGIGGGIFLSPILHLLRQDTAKRIAATASLFILTNSVAGLGGQLWQNGVTVNWLFALPLLLAVFVGGQLGSRLSVYRLPSDYVRYATALLVLYAGIKLLL
jgi:uncharacterized protein